MRVECGRHRLLQLDIPRRQRAAPHLVSELRLKWNVEAICRFCVSGSDEESRCFVLDALDPAGPVSGGLVWVEISGIRWAATEPPDAREHFHAALAQARSHEEDPLRGNFAGSGWFNEVTAWTQSRLGARGLKLSAGWEQHNIGPDFSLIRFETTGPAVWFKAVGGSNLREYAITTALSELHSKYLPEILGTHADWRCWLMLDGNGKHLDEVWELGHWERAAASLAELQIESLQHCELLLAAGCENLRIEKLRGLIEPFLSTVANLMDLQPSSPPPVLDLHDLRFIEARLVDACHQSESLGMPNALGNTDLNPGNVLVNQDGATFLDWMQGYIGPPFVMLEYLLALLRRLRPDLTEWAKPLQEAYCQRWTGICSAYQMFEALKLSPLVAILAYGVTLPDWRENARNVSPNSAKLIRSLGRKMLLAAQGLDPSCAGRAD